MLDHLHVQLWYISKRLLVLYLYYVWLWGSWHLLKVTRFECRLFGQLKLLFNGGQRVSFLHLVEVNLELVVIFSLDSWLLKGTPLGLSVLKSWHDLVWELHFALILGTISFLMDLLNRLNHAHINGWLLSRYFLCVYLLVRLPSCQRIISWLLNVNLLKEVLLASFLSYL